MQITYSASSRVTTTRLYSSLLIISSPQDVSMAYVTNIMRDKVHVSEITSCPDDDRLLDRTIVISIIRLTEFTGPRRYISRTVIWWAYSSSAGCIRHLQTTDLKGVEWMSSCLCLAEDGFRHLQMTLYKESSANDRPKPSHLQSTIVHILQVAKCVIYKRSFCTLQVADIVLCRCLFYVTQMTR